MFEQEPGSGPVTLNLPSEASSLSAAETCDHVDRRAWLKEPTRENKGLMEYPEEAALGRESFDGVGADQMSLVCV